jgi:hypothetical protein
MDQLILKRASASRTSGERNDDDFNVRAEGAVLGRISRPTVMGKSIPGQGFM